MPSLRYGSSTSHLRNFRAPRFAPHQLHFRHCAAIGSYRQLVTLAIETSCDDTSVAVFEDSGPVTGGGSSGRGNDSCNRSNDDNNKRKAILHFHEKITSDNSAYGGIHPIVSLESHQESLAGLLTKATQFLPPAKDSGVVRRPDFVSVTRGPGMRANLFTGLNTAKGLAVAWNVPLVGVHHMQAHALTPRLVAALEGSPIPEFPFLSVLVSGGHTLLIRSTSLTEHSILASTSDIAIGDCLDKIARAVLPPALLAQSEGTMYGALLEKFAFPHGGSSSEYDYTAPVSLRGMIKKRDSGYGWAFSPPFAVSASSLKAMNMEFSFTGIATAAERIVQFKFDRSSGKLTNIAREDGELDESERRVIAREAMRTAFEHLAVRVVLALQDMTAAAAAAEAAVSSTELATDNGANSLVLSGGVAANGYLRHIVSHVLGTFGFNKLRLLCPPPALCTDNAAMIAWTGMEMFLGGHITPLSARALRKWPLDVLLNPPIGN